MSSRETSSCVEVSIITRSLFISGISHVPHNAQVLAWLVCQVSLDGI